MEQDTKSKSPFFVGVTEAIGILMVLYNGQAACRMVGGKTEDIETNLLNYMKKNHSVAEIICRTALTFHFMMAQRVLRVSTPPVPPEVLLRNG